MLQMGMTLAVIMATFEIYCHRSFPRLGKYVEKSATTSLVFSMVLAVLMGMIFPSSGVIALMGAVGGTVIVQPYYVSIRKARQVKNALEARKAKKQ